MSVESKNSKIAQKENGDKKGTGLSDRIAAAPKELDGIGKILAQRRIMRDTTNHPSVELSRTGRADAVRRRLQKSASTNTRSANISDSGSPDDAGTDGGSSDSGSNNQ